MGLFTTAASIAIVSIIIACTVNRHDLSEFIDDLPDFLMIEFC